VSGSTRAYDGRMRFLVLFVVGVVGLAGCDALPFAVHEDPVAIFSAEPTSGSAPLVVSFDARDSQAPNGSIVAFEWAFGDGGSASHLNRTPTHVYASSGVYTVTLKVTTAVGGTDEAVATIFVSPGDGHGGSVQSVAIDGGDRHVGVGETLRLTATVDASEGVDTSVIWNSSVSGVASVDPTGLVTGIVTGVTNITATSVANSSVRASVQVTVSDQPAIGSVRIDQRNPSLIVGDAQRLTVTVAAIAGADPSVHWFSGNPAVLSIDASGYVLAVAEGVAVIRVTSVFDATRSDSVEVRVIDASSLRFAFGQEPIAAGASHTLFVGDDGMVWAWGSNASGQLGVDTVEPGRIAPVHVPGLADAVAVAAGAAFSLARASDGRVWAWGENGSGQLGDGTLTSRHVPEAILELADAKAVAAGSFHALALVADGSLYAWGKNDKGQLGDASNTDRRTATRVAGLPNVVAIAAGANHSLAVTDAGAVWAWGENDAGQLGDGTTTNRNRPVEVGSLTGMLGVTAGSAHSLAIDASGRLWAWGRNLDGQLGDGTTDARTSPVRVAELSGVVSLSAGSQHSVAVRHDGSAWAWGQSSFGQLGDGSQGATRTHPVRIGSANDAHMVAAGALHSVLLTTDGALRAWGRNVDGQLGISSWTDLFASPRTLRDRLSNVTAVSVAAWHSLALVDGWLWSWGSDRSGALGHGTSSSGLYLPRRVMAMASPSSMAAGAASWGGVSATIDASGDLWTWGDNDQGVLGHGSTTEATSPTRVTAVSNVADVAVGQAFMIARIADGTLWSWGRNPQGQLGIGSTTSSSTPARLTTLTTVSRVAAGTTHAIALRADGTVWAWGGNLYGQLGDGTTTGKTSPTPISFEGNPRITAVAAGDGFSVALDDLGSVWTWGANWSGQLGNGALPSTGSRVPIKVPSLTSVEAIAVGAGHVLALRTDRTVWAWGDNSDGQIGIGTTDWARTEPTQVPNLHDVHAIAAGGGASMAIRSDGRLWAWGSNTAGTLGDGTARSRSAPVHLW
jgi:alpha-tubulin suppressor-like RCC1 family protein